MSDTVEQFLTLKIDNLLNKMKSSSVSAIQALSEDNMKRYGHYKELMAMYETLHDMYVGVLNSRRLQVTPVNMVV